MANPDTAKSTDCGGKSKSAKAHSKKSNCGRPANRCRALPSICADTSASVKWAFGNAGSSMALISPVPAPKSKMCRTFPACRASRTAMP